MRIGNNPHKDKETSHANYWHQVVVPVYIPNFDGYFKDSFQIFQLCISSLLATIHNKTFVTIINNGSCIEIRNYLDALYQTNKIQEVIHSENIGKLNAILKGISGNNIPYVTISDADVLFCTNWQKETMQVFNSFNKAGVVGITPQFKTYEVCCGNLLYENYLNSNLKFTKVAAPEGLKKFIESLGWKEDYNKNYLAYNLSITKGNCKALVGSGHFVATYSKNVFKELPSFFSYKMGGDSEAFLDAIPLKYNMYRLTTTHNFAYHMGNVLENWMTELVTEKTTNFNYELYTKSRKYRKISTLEYFIKNKLFCRLCFSNKFFKNIFYIKFQLPKIMRNKY